MNYIYDIYLNLNETLYDFFDWNKNDKLIHVKKIPIFKVNEDKLKLLIQNKVEINSDFLKQIYNKTEIWNISNKINYLALFSDNNTSLAIEFNEKGNTISKSYLFIDEELEVLEIVYKLKEKNIDFNILNKEKNILKTRKQIKEEKFINQELKNMEQSKLKYIYFECFGKHEKDKKTIVEKINKLSKNSRIYKNLYDILKLTSKANK